MPSRTPTMRVHKQCVHGGVRGERRHGGVRGERRQGRLPWFEAEKKDAVGGVLKLAKEMDES